MGHTFLPYSTDPIIPQRSQPFRQKLHSLSRKRMAACLPAIPCGPLLPPYLIIGDAEAHCSTNFGSFIGIQLPRRLAPRKLLPLSLSLHEHTAGNWLNKRWSLGCVNPASWLPLAAVGDFTQPRAHLLADPCTRRVFISEWSNLKFRHVRVHPC